MKKLIKKEGFALISVFIISVLLAGIIGFTYVSVSRGLNLKNITYNSKKSFTVADAGLEYMINMVQKYHFYTLPEYLAFEINSGEPVINSLTNYLNSLEYCNSLNNEDKTTIQNIINQSFSTYLSKGQYFYDFYGIDNINKKLLDSRGNFIDINTNPDLGLIRLSQRFSQELNKFSLNIYSASFNEDCSSCIESILSAIKNDINSSYANWSQYVIDKMTLLVNSLGGYSGVSNECPPEDKIIKEENGVEVGIIIPYDIDYPVVDESQISYEGVIVRTADEIRLYSSDVDIYPTRKLIISAVAYVFNKPVPKSIYKSSIRDKLELVCPREEDAEYKKYPLKNSGSNSYPQIDHKVYINALDVDKTNLNLKNAGLSYEFTPIKRGIRAEFQIPFIIGEDEPEATLFVIPGTIVRWTPSGEELPTPPPPSQIFPYNYPYYILATNNDITLPSSEHIIGPVRTNNRVYFYGEINDVIIARRGVTYRGKFEFTHNGVEYVVDFGEWNHTETLLPISPIPPQNSGIVVQNGKVKISQDRERIYDSDGIERVRSWYIDLDADGNYDNGLDRLFLYYTNEAIPLVDPNASNSLINQARQEIYNATYGTPYYVTAPNNGYVEIDIQNNKVKYRINGRGEWTTLDISSNPGTVMYINGEVYFKGGGFLDGKLTIYATKDVHFEGGPVRYRDNPKSYNDGNLPTETDSIDMLGVITPGKVYLTNNSSNSMKIDVNILTGSGIVSDKNNPNKIKVQGSMSFYNTYTGEYRYELLNFDYNLFVTRPPSFPLLDLPCPSPPILISPSYAVSGIPLTPKFVWGPSFGMPPINYTLEIATDENFNNIIFQQNVGSVTNYTLPSGILSSNTIYYWRVRASNNSCSDISVKFYFKTQANENDLITQKVIQGDTIGGRVVEAYFSRRLWREMVSPP
jgi:hypothetical protein